MTSTFFSEGEPILEEQGMIFLYKNRMKIKKMSWIVNSISHWKWTWELRMKWSNFVDIKIKNEIDL